MASATATDDSRPLPFESLPLIDLRLLTQSELYSLSLLSVSSPSPSSQDDVVVPIPKIDRSVFNESAGSRKQTYFRLRLASRTTSNPLHPSAHVSRQKTPEPFEEENSRIISLLKDLFAHHTEPEPPLPTTPEDEGSLIEVPVTYDECVPESSNSILQSIPIGVLDIKFSVRKRGRPRKLHSSENFSDGKEDLDSEDKEEENPTERASPMAACDLDSFEEELKRRTQGMRTEEELSGFLRGLSGEWGSRKKKRKIVDARCLGDVLPIGWKLLLSIKSDGDRAWLGCSRYISPDGLQFVSSKDVSAHLLSSFGVQDASHENSGPANESSWLTCRMTSENLQSADPTLQMERNQDEVVCLSAVPISSIPAYHHTEAPLSVGGSLGNSQTKESYRCHKCTMTFEEKDNLLLHLLSSHKKSRNTSNGAKNSDSVIMKEGKYECQLCHKLFEEKNRFSSHFGNHIKDYVKRVEASGETNRAHKRTPKVQEMIASGRLSRAVLENTEAVEKGHLNLPHSIIETGAIAKTQSRSDGHHVNIHPIEPVAMSEKNEEHDAEYAQKHERYSGLSNDYIGVVDEADKIDSELNVSKDLIAVSSTAHTNKASEIPEKLIAYNSENKANMNSVISMEDCRQEMVPVSRVFSATENNKPINNESLVNSLFGSPVEDLDVDDGDGIEDNELPPGIEDRCLGLAEGIPDSGKQKISSERCSLVQFGSKEKSVNADDLTGTHTSILDKESCSENCLPSRGQVLLANDSQGKVIGGSLQERGSLNSWNGEKAINFGQNVADRSVQEVGSSFPVIPTVNKQTYEFDENLKGFSVPKLQKTWQQEAFESNILSAHQKSSSADVNSGKISDTIRNLQSLSQSRSDSPVLNHIEKERSSGGTLPVASLDQKAFVLNTREAQVPTVDKPKACRGFTGLYAGDHNSVDKSSENLTVSNTVHTPKQGQSLGSNWNDKSSFGIECRHPLQHGGPVMGFEAWANPPRSSEVAIPEYRRASPFGSAIEELKQNKESAFGLLSRSVDHQQACVTGYNPDMFCGGALPDNRQAGNLETFRNNEQMIGLYSQQQHKHHGEAVARSMWREEQNFNILHNSNLNYVSQSAAQPSHSFPAFNLVPDKVQNEFYASNEKLGDTPAVAGGVRVGGSGSFMEYNFLSAPPSAQGSRISSFNQQMGQGLESNWSEREASGLFPKMGSGAGGSSGSRHHQVTALCVWCGNQFSNEGDFDVGDGSVGYMCFNCKAKFAGQINFF